MDDQLQVQPDIGMVERQNGELAVIGLKDASGSLDLLCALTAFPTKPVLCGEDLFFPAPLPSNASSSGRAICPPRRSVCR